MVKNLMPHVRFHVNPYKVSHNGDHIVKPGSENIGQNNDAHHRKKCCVKIFGQQLLH